MKLEQKPVLKQKQTIKPRLSVHQLIEQLNVHEAECALRYKRIEEKLAENRAAIKQFDIKIWGLAVLIIAQASILTMIAQKVL